MKKKPFLIFKKYNNFKTAFPSTSLKIISSLQLQNWGHTTVGASQLIANLPMNECPFVLMILISFFHAASDLDFEDPYLIKR